MRIAVDSLGPSVKYLTILRSFGATFAFRCQSKATFSAMDQSVRQRSADKHAYVLAMIDGSWIAERSPHGKLEVSGRRA
jgi:hypothetical protein